MSHTLNKLLIIFPSLHMTEYNSAKNKKRTFAVTLRYLIKLKNKLMTVDIPLSDTNLNVLLLRIVESSIVTEILLYTQQFH
jgi:hypothetical protein